MSLRPDFLSDLDLGRTVLNPETIPADSPVQNQVFSLNDADINLILPWYKGKGVHDSHIIVMKNLSVLTLSRNRAQYPVTGCGTRGIRGFTKGNRMTAGSFGFTIGAESAFSEAIRKYQKFNGLGDFEAKLTTADELPPMDLLVTRINEYGNASILWIKSFVLVDDNRVLSVHDPQSTETYSFMAAEATNWYRP